MTITVNYWRGTTLLTGKARTYRGAMRLASKNQNALHQVRADQLGVRHG